MYTKSVLLVKYGEISLRKGNRAHFEHALLDTLRLRLKGMENIRVAREQGRFLIENTAGDLDTAAVVPLIKDVFGITGFCYAIKTSERDLARLAEIGRDFFIKNLPEHVKNFRVETKRSDKNYPSTSTEISATIGEVIFMAKDEKLAVELRRPEITLWVEIRNDVYFYVNSLRGVGGLPYGSSGKGVLLLSGGFDSPVAGYLTARRGVEIVAVYFHSPPFTSERAADKARDLAAQLAKFAGKIRLYIVPFTDIQVFLKSNVAEEKLTIFLKRAMLRVASRVAKKENALCLVTGDSIGQVASQTIHSLAAVETAAFLPILRPLAAMDKQDIIDMAEKIGTYEISVRPYEDCCTVFVAKHPENKPNATIIEAMEARFLAELSKLSDIAINDTQICEFRL